MQQPDNSGVTPLLVAKMSSVTNPGYKMECLGPLISFEEKSKIATPQSRTISSLKIHKSILVIGHTWVPLDSPAVHGLVHFEPVRIIYVRPWTITCFLFLGET